MAKEGKTTVVPKLRFPEFRARPGWESTLLGDASTQVTERVGGRELTLVSISAGVGFVPQSEKFGRDISGNQYSLYTVVRDGDFVYNKGNSLKFPQGCVYQLRGRDEVAAPNVFISFRLKQGFVAEYFQYCFEKNIHGAQLKKHITSGARSNGLLNVSKDQFYGISIPTPPPDEQQKIADCLSTLDELIAAQGRKVKALKTYKRGLMQQLFPREGEPLPRLRFPEFRDAPEWGETPLGYLVGLLSGYPFDGTDIVENSAGVPLMRGINVTEGSVRHSREIDRYYLGPLNGLEKYRLEKNDLVIGMDGSKVGKNSALISEADADSLLIQRVARLRATSVSAIKFIFQQIHSLRFHAYVDRINTSSGIPHISAKQIKEYPIHSTGEEEQQRVAEFLSLVDTQIVVEADKLTALKAHKKGLMQQLFPSLE